MKLPSSVTSSSSSKGSTLSVMAGAAEAVAAEIEGNVLPGHAKERRVASVEIQAVKKTDANKSKKCSRPTYACATCGKVFITKQALGGHQNAHREGKAKTKKKKQKVVAEFLDHMKQEDELNEAGSSNVGAEDLEVNDTVDGLDLSLHL